jgi:hypothetical protein
MAVYERYEKWSRWKGSVEEIEALASLAKNQAEAITESKVHLTISQSKPGSTNEFDSIDEFAEWFAPSEADATTTLTLRVVQEATTDNPLSAEVGLSRDHQQPGARLVVRGLRAKADALFPPLEERVVRGRRKLQMGQAGVVFVGMGVLILAMAAWYSVLPFIHLPEVSPAAATVLTIAFTIGGALAGAFIVGGTAFALNWLVPQLEIVPENGETKWRHVRTWVVLSVGAVIVGPVISAWAVKLAKGD